jgi:hypothetical protein
MSGTYSEPFFFESDTFVFIIPTCIRIAVLSTPERAKTGDSSTPSFKGCLGNNKFTYILNNDK